MFITLIKNDNDSRSDLGYQLQHAGYQVTTFACGDDFLLFHNKGHRTDMLLLNINSQDGLQLAQRFKAHKGMGIVILTESTSLKDRLCGLEAGADAFLTMPVNVLELDAVIRSIYRRICAESRPDERTALCQLHSDKRVLKLNSGDHVDLTATEGIVLHTLARYAPKAVSRQSLSESLGCDYRHYDERKLEAIISRLRRKIKQANPEVEAIKAARGRGYQLLLQVSME